MASPLSSTWHPAPFFVLRTPLTPFTFLTEWSRDLDTPGVCREGGRDLEQTWRDDVAKVRARLMEFMRRPEVREAISVASPGFEKALAAWFERPESKQGQKLERAVIRYVLRMCGRWTPFGLFAGCALGSIGGRSELTLDDVAPPLRRTRLDMDYVTLLCEALAAGPLKQELEYTPNSSLYKVGDRWRYAEWRLVGETREYRLVSVSSSDYLDSALARAGAGATRSEIAAAITDSDAEVTLDEALEFVDELIDRQLLCSELIPALSGPDPMTSLVERLERSAAGAPLAPRLVAIREALARIDASPLGGDPARYAQVAAQLPPVAVDIDPAHLFQVDLMPRVKAARLGEVVAREILRGASALARIAPADRALERFKGRFSLRYEEREVPLVEALDDDYGVGLEGGAQQEDAPLLGDLLFPERLNETTSWSRRENWLFQSLYRTSSSGDVEVALQDSDLAELQALPEPLPLPDAFSVHAAILAPSSEALARGEFRVMIGPPEGPSGARPLGRFCDVDPALAERVREHLREEEALAPEAVFAEIVHSPQGRVGNVTFRPALRGYEIPFIARSMLPRERQILPADLLVSVRRDRVVLRSRRLGVEVLPRLSTAHNYSYAPHNLPLYRFLCAVQDQGIGGMSGWSWAPFRLAPRYPRVVHGRVVLSLARWNLGPPEVEQLRAARGAEVYRAVQQIREERGVPRFVTAGDGDRRLPFDLDNPLCVEALRQLVGRRPQLEVTEILDPPDQLCATGVAGGYRNETVVPFIRRGPPRPRAEAQPTFVAPTRAFAPGSEWLYAKLYGGTPVANHALRAIASVVADVSASGAADRWFFLRYADPDPHLRVRFHGPADRLLGEVLPALHRALAPLRDVGSIRSMQLDTYEREVERYAGLGVELAEELFCADSDAVLELLDWVDGADHPEALAHVAIAGAHRLLLDLGMSLAERCELVDSARSDLAREFHLQPIHLRPLGERYRRDRELLARLVDPDARDHPISKILPLFDRRSRRIAEIVARARRAGSTDHGVRRTVPSLIHMHLNRLFHTAPREQEMVVYDLLARVYDSQRARGRC